MDVKKLLDEMNDSISSSYDRSLEKTLDRLGLERKNSSKDILPALGIFGAGIAVGATLGVLFAPKRGDELRSEIAKNLEELRERSRESYDQVARESRRRFEEARDRVQEARNRGGSSASSAASDSAANEDSGEGDSDTESAGE